MYTDFVGSHRSRRKSRILNRSAPRLLIRPAAPVFRHKILEHLCNIAVAGILAGDVRIVFLNRAGFRVNRRRSRLRHERISGTVIVVFENPRDPKGKVRHLRCLEVKLIHLTGDQIPVCTIGTDFIRFHVRSPKCEITQVFFESRHMEVEIDRTDWRLQCIGDELNELRRMDWRYIIYKPFSDTWTHEHCVLCNACIDEGDSVWMNEPIQTEKTLFICSKCMENFAETFGKNG